MSSTVADNRAVSDPCSDPYGGGLFSRPGGEPVIRNSIFAGNDGPYGPRGPDIYGVVRSAGFNLIGDDGGTTLKGGQGSDLTNVDPLLGGLMDNGGKTRTHALRAGSPGVDAGSCTDDLGDTIDQDQRGVKRPQGLHCDIGAYEFSQPSLALDKGVDDSTPGLGQRITFTIVVGNDGAADATAGTISDALPAGLSLAGSVVLEPATAGTLGAPPALVTDLTVLAGKQVTVSLPVTVSPSLPTPTAITNVATVTSEEVFGPVTDSCTVIVGNLQPSVYLPMVVRALQ